MAYNPSELNHPDYKNYYNKEDLHTHTTLENCWVSIFGKVLDLSPLLITNSHSLLIKPILLNAGKDISHWFDPKTKNPKTRIDINSGKRVFFTPEGRFLHVPSQEPSSEPVVELPWWKDPQYVIGALATKSRLIRIINMLTHDEEKLEVPEQETLNEILDRYMAINKHAKSYTWKNIHGKVLDMNQTLSQNGIVDEDPEYDYLDVADADRHIPALLLYFNDDLTTA